MNSRHRSSYKTGKAIMEFFMTLLWLFFGIFIAFSEKIIGTDFFENSPFLQGGMRWFIAALFVLYGIFRAFRAVKLFKNRHNNED
ncbi:hypothetical protein O3P16_01040 [Chitinophagaceae bacterium LY-5]|uniref:Uncharacterized protein n=1 Tax=Polluticaenibacter yanchengensis TaxID=3014562 RepID=A0ABT4UEW6_9BACT|nr:hypothetical protein [Chitinophagaceae bacterium LY-5]